MPTCVRPGGMSAFLDEESHGDGIMSWEADLSSINGFAAPASTLKAVLEDFPTQKCAAKILWASMATPLLFKHESELLSKATNTLTDDEKQKLMAWYADGQSSSRMESALFA